MTITVGQKSIGLSNSLRQAPTLPSLNLSVDQRIAEILNKMEELTVAVNLKADQDKLRTLIAYSKEAIYLQAENIALMGDITIAKIIGEQNGTTSGQLPIQVTRIIGNMIQTGSVLSNNWSATEGTNINLDDSTITMGGYDNPSLYYDGAGNLTISGTLTAASIVQGTGTSLGTVVSGVNTALANLYSDSLVRNLLAAGVGNVLAGAGQDYTLSVQSNSIIAAHKDVNPAGLGSSYAGVLRTGLIVTANGVAMGYNRKSDGAWVNSVAIDGTTGDGIFSGALVAATGTFSGSLSAASGSFAGTVTGGSIVSTNWGASEGTNINLNTSVITLGGSSNPSLYYDGAGNLTISGTLASSSVVSGTGTNLATVVSNANTAAANIYTDTNARNLLAAGVNNVLAGVGQNYTLTVAADAVVAQHKDANIAGLGSGYAGTLRTGLAITSNGIAMGYNRKSDGAWVNSVAIDGTTGDGTFSGALVGATGSFGGSLSAATGTFAGTLSAANGSFSGQLLGATGSFSGSLSAATGTFAGSLSAATGTFSGNLSAAGGTFTGTLSGATGTFSGSLAAASGTFTGSLSGATGTFSGSLTTSGNVFATGGNVNGGFTAAIHAIPTAGGTAFYGKSTTGSPTAQFAKEGSGNALIAQSTGGIGAFCSGATAGVWGVATGSGRGVVGQAASSEGVAVDVSFGRLQIAGNRITKTQNNAHLLKVYDLSGVLIDTFTYAFE